MLNSRTDRRVSQKSYDPFGMLLVGRNYSMTSENYRFGVGGHENTDEFLGENIAIDFGFRIFNSLIGKFLSCDPLTKKNMLLVHHTYIVQIIL